MQLLQNSGSALRVLEKATQPFQRQLRTAFEGIFGTLVRTQIGWS